jgi:hypothetical protein
MSDKSTEKKRKKLSAFAGQAKLNDENKARIWHVERHAIRDDAKALQSSANKLILDSA